MTPWRNLMKEEFFLNKDDHSLEAWIDDSVLNLCRQPFRRIEGRGPKIRLQALLMINIVRIRGKNQRRVVFHLLMRGPIGLLDPLETLTTTMTNI